MPSLPGCHIHVLARSTINTFLFFLLLFVPFESLYNLRVTTNSQAYHEMARKFHPDKNKDPGATDKMKEVSFAYEVLSDPEKRRVYDEYGIEGIKEGIGSGRMSYSVLSVLLFCIM